MVRWSSACLPGQQPITDIAVYSAVGCCRRRRSSLITFAFAFSSSTAAVPRCVRLPTIFHHRMPTVIIIHTTLGDARRGSCCISPLFWDLATVCIAVAINVNNWLPDEQNCPTFMRGASSSYFLDFQQELSWSHWVLFTSFLNLHPFFKRIWICRSRLMGDL